MGLVALLPAEARARLLNLIKKGFSSEDEKYVRIAAAS
jgi:hypothetical protein